MITHVRTDYATTHSGLDRMMEGSGAAQAFVQKSVTGTNLLKTVTAVGMMAAVTLAERTLDRVQTGFATEWAILSLVALVAFWFMVSAVVPFLRWAKRSLVALNAQWEQQTIDRRYLESAHSDPRIMGELIAARDRAGIVPNRKRDELVLAPAWHQLPTYW